MPENESPYTLCYQHDDGGTSVYLFPSPIAYYDGDECKPIDNTLVPIKNAEMKKQGYAYENQSNDIKLHFPKDLSQTPFLIQREGFALTFTPEGQPAGTKIKKTNYQDSFGREHSAAAYPAQRESQFLYVPTNSGILVPITITKRPEISQLNFDVYSEQELSFQNNENRYFTVYDHNNATAAVIYTSFLQDANGKTSFRQTVQARQEENKWKVTICLDQDFLDDPEVSYPLTIAPSFELYRNKMPDSTVYENMPDTNLYLDNFAVFGEPDIFGKGLHHIRFRINYILKTYAQNIKTASYVAPVIAGGSSPIKIELSRLKDVWSSTAITWKTKPKAFDAVNTTEIAKTKSYELDITEFVKACVMDDQWNTEVYGLEMQEKEPSGQSTKMIATSDNTFYQPYIKIDFYDEPWTFEHIEMINPDGGL